MLPNSSEGHQEVRASTGCPAGASLARSLNTRFSEFQKLLLLNFTLFVGTTCFGALKQEIHILNQ